MCPSVNCHLCLAFITHWRLCQPAGHTGLVSPLRTVTTPPRFYPIHHVYRNTFPLAWGVNKPPETLIEAISSLWRFYMRLTLARAHPRTHTHKRESARVCVCVKFQNRLYFFANVRAAVTTRVTCSEGTTYLIIVYHWDMINKCLCNKQIHIKSIRNSKKTVFIIYQISKFIDI